MKAKIFAKIIRTHRSKCESFFFPTVIEKINKLYHKNINEILSSTEIISSVNSDDYLTLILGNKFITRFGFVEFKNAKECLKILVNPIKITKTVMTY